MNWQKTQSPWLKILAVFGADEPMSSVSAQKQSPWVETVSPRAHEFRHNPKKGPQKTPKFMGSLPHDRAHITCWLGSGCPLLSTGVKKVNESTRAYLILEVYGTTTVVLTLWHFSFLYWTLTKVGGREQLNWTYVSLCEWNILCWGIWDWLLCGGTARGICFLLENA